MNDKTTLDEHKQALCDALEAAVRQNPGQPFKEYAKAGMPIAQRLITFQNIHRVAGMTTHPDINRVFDQAMQRLRRAGKLQCVKGKWSVVEPKKDQG